MSLVFQLVYSSRNDDDAVRVVGTFGTRLAADKARETVLRPQHADFLMMLRSRVDGSRYDVARSPEQGRTGVASRAANEAVLVTAEAALAAAESFESWIQGREPLIIAIDVV
jgi:hypothetical protein